jgi:DNA-binding NarL/FixJ family response regulator
MTDWTSARPDVPAPASMGRSETGATAVDPRGTQRNRINPPVTMTQSVNPGTGRARIDVPRQRLPANYSAVSHHQETVLLADPGGAIDEVLRPALLQFADCRIVHAGTVSEVLDLVGSGEVGDLAMVSLQFQANTPVVIRKLREAGWPRVLALTTAAMPVAPVIEAIRAGASGVLSVAGVIESQPDENNPSRNLSPRELEVVRLVADGWSNKAIASQLSLSALTVKNHLARIGRKFGVGDRAHIVAIACRGGVIPNSVRQPRRFD